MDPSSASTASRKLPINLVYELSEHLVPAAGERRQFYSFMATKCFVHKRQWAPPASAALRTEAPKADEGSLTLEQLVDLVVAFRQRAHSLFLRRLRNGFRQFDAKNSGFIPRTTLLPLLTGLNAGGKVPPPKLAEFAAAEKTELVSFSELAESLEARTLAEFGSGATLLRLLSEH